MPDFDVQVIGLSSPLAAAPVTTYTPAVSVRNNGLSAVTVTGVVRRYQTVAPGELLQTIQLTPKSIAAGATSDVLCSQTWTPTTGEIGTSYIFTADVVAKDDQVEENNHLSPTVITVVTGAPPPPPPVVTTHAAQHEHGGTDELNVGGLAGELQDEQAAKDHAGKHEQGGADELSVNGLLGTLATPQPTAAHANEKHIIPFASVAALAAHDAAATAHASATNLEQTSRKGVANGYAPLGADSKVPTANLPPLGSATPGENRNRAFESDPQATKELIRLDFGSGEAQTGRGIHFDVNGWMSHQAGADPSFVLQSSDDGINWNYLTAFGFGILPPSENLSYLDAVIDGVIRPTEIGPDPLDMAITWRVLKSQPEPGDSFKSPLIRVGIYLKNLFTPTAQYRYLRVCIYWDAAVGFCHFAAARLQATTNELQDQAAFYDCAAVGMSHTMPAKVGVPMGVSGQIDNVGDVTATYVVARLVVTDPLGTVVLNQDSAPQTINVGQSYYFNSGFTPTMPGDYAAQLSVVWLDDENPANNLTGLAINVVP